MTDAHDVCKHYKHLVNDLKPCHITGRVNSPLIQSPKLIIIIPAQKKKNFSHHNHFSSCIIFFTLHNFIIPKMSNNSNKICARLCSTFFTLSPYAERGGRKVKRGGRARVVGGKGGREGKENILRITHIYAPALHTPTIKEYG